jgi:hypothetical protein
MRKMRITPKQGTRSPEDRSDYNFAVVTIALMVFFVIAGFSAWVFSNSDTAAANPPAPHSSTR